MNEWTSNALLRRGSLCKDSSFWLLLNFLWGLEALWFISSYSGWTWGARLNTVFRKHSSQQGFIEKLMNPRLYEKGIIPDTRTSAPSTRWQMTSDRHCPSEMRERWGAWILLAASPKRGKFFRLVLNLRFLQLQKHIHVKIQGLPGRNEDSKTLLSFRV